MCIQVNCTVPGTCQANKTGFSDSVLVFLKKSKSTEHVLNFHMEGGMKPWSHKWLDWDIPVQRKKRLRRSFQKWRLAGNSVQLLKRDLAESSRSSQSEAERLKDQVLRHLVADRAAPEKENQKQDLLKNGQSPREQNPRSALPPKSNNVNRSQDADDLPQVSGCWGCLGQLSPSSVWFQVDFHLELSKWWDTFPGYQFSASCQQSMASGLGFCLGFGVGFPPSLFLSWDKLCWSGKVSQGGVCDNAYPLYNHTVCSPNGKERWHVSGNCLGAESCYL